MPTRIVRVVNNTCITLQYHNTESDHKTVLKSSWARSHREHNTDGPLPTSDFHDDTVPWHPQLYRDRNTDKFIKISFGQAEIYIMVLRNRFCFVGPVYSTVPAGTYTDGIYGDYLPKDGQYVLRVDEAVEGKTNVARLTILKYDEEKYTVTNGCIESSALESMDIVAGPVTMLMFGPKK